MRRGSAVLLALRRGCYGLTLAAALSVYGSAALAQSGSSSPFDGFYVGAQVGANDVMSKVGSTNTVTGSLSIENGVTDKSSLSYGVFAGYGRVLANSIYLGAELDYSDSDHH